MPRYEDEGPTPKKPRPALRFSKPFTIAQVPDGFELRDASGIVMANVPATAFPDEFPNALSIEDATRVAVRLRDKMNAEDPRPAPEETREPERDQGVQQGSAPRAGGNANRASRGRSSGSNGSVQDGGSRRQYRQGVQR